MRHGDDTADLVVTDADPAPGHRDIGGHGCGLRGLAERVAAAGGQLHAGPAETGWRVSALVAPPGAAPAGSPDGGLTDGLPGGADPA